MLIANPDYSQIFLIELRIEYFRSFSVVPPCEAFASLFSHTVFDYRGIPTENWLIATLKTGLKQGQGRYNLG
jgi:hypothetical protein